MKKLVSVLLAFILASQCCVVSFAQVSKPVEESMVAPTVEESATSNQNAAGDASSALPPQMGWSSWNFFKQHIDEVKIRSIADALISTKLSDLGYKYINLDDCWQSSLRDKNGRMQFDPSNFPSGSKLIDDFHKKGLKVGIYSSTGPYTCEDLVGSMNNEDIDAQTFADWGVDFLKLDYCHVKDGANVGEAPSASPKVTYIDVVKKDSVVSEPITLPTRYPSTAAAPAVTLTGTAAKSGNAITGLNSNGGTLTFHTVNVPTAGEYVITVGIEKIRGDMKYLQILPNDDMSKMSDVYFYPTSGWHDTGRYQAYVTLKAGVNKIKLFNPIDGQKSDSIRRYSKMGNALKKATAATAAATGKPENPIFFNICEHGRTQPWTWASQYANSWRISGDISANWGSIVSKYDIAIGLTQHQTSGKYNDPDMMEVGNGSLSVEQNRSHFSLWCMLSAPLVLGCDIRNFVSTTATDGIDRNANYGAYDIISNEAMIKINQSQPLLQCKRVSNANSVDVLVKPLIGNEVALCFFNRSNAAKSVNFDINTINTLDDRCKLPEAIVYNAVDLWDKALPNNFVSNMLNSGSIPANGVKVYKVTATNRTEVAKAANLAININSPIALGANETFTATITNLGSDTIQNAKLTLTSPAEFTSTGPSLVAKNYFHSIGTTGNKTPIDNGVTVDNTANSITMTETAGDLWASSNTANGLIMFNPTIGNEFTATVKMVGAPSADYAQSALVFYKDNNNYVLIGRQFRGGSEGKKLDVTNEIGGAGDFWAPSTAADFSQPIWFKIAKTANSYAISTSTNGTDYTALRTVTNANLGTAFKVGYWVGGSNTNGSKSTFSELKFNNVAQPLQVIAGADTPVTLAKGETKTATWTVTAPNTAGNYDFTVNGRYNYTGEEPINMSKTSTVNVSTTAVPRVDNIAINGIVAPALNAAKTTATTDTANCSIESTTWKVNGAAYAGATFVAPNIYSVEIIAKATGAYVFSTGITVAGYNVARSTDGKTLTITKTYPIVDVRALPGDVTGDNKVDLEDGVVGVKVLANIIPERSLSRQQMANFKQTNPMAAATKEDVVKILVQVILGG